MNEQCSVIKKAVINTISIRNVKTIDIGGLATTSEFMKTFLDEVKILTPSEGYQLFVKN